MQTQTMLRFVIRIHKYNNFLFFNTCVWYFYIAKKLAAITVTWSKATTFTYEKKKGKIRNTSFVKIYSHKN